MRNHKPGQRVKILTAGMFAASAMFLGSPSCAATWISTARSEYGTAYSYDVDSLEREGAKVTVWIRGVSAYGGSDKTRSRYDCNRRTVTTLSATTYRADGSVQNSFTWSPGQQAELSVLPGTYADKILRAVCSRK